MEPIENNILPVKKKWQKPDFYIIDSQHVNSGGVPNGVEGQLTPNATPPVNPANSAYYS